MKHRETYSASDLLVYCQKIRLDKEEAIITRNIEKCMPEDGSQKISVFFKNTSKKFNKWVNDYERIYNQLVENKTKFNELHPEVLNKEEAEDLVNKLFVNDKYGLVKLVFSTSVLLDEEYKFEYKEEGLMEVSKFLYGSDNTLLTIHDELERNYKEIYAKELSTVQKGVLAGTALICLAGVIICPVIASTTAYVGTSVGVGTFLANTGIVATESVLLGAAITGAVYGGMKFYNAQKVKEEFKKLTPEDSALYLAIQMTLISKLRKELDPEEFKNELDEILKSINNLKGDLDFYLFVENDERDINIDKLKQFHKFDKRLLDVLQH